MSGPRQFWTTSRKAGNNTQKSKCEPWFCDRREMPLYHNVMDNPALTCMYLWWRCSFIRWLCDILCVLSELFWLNLHYVGLFTEFAFRIRVLMRLWAGNCGKGVKVCRVDAAEFKSKAKVLSRVLVKLLSPLHSCALKVDKLEPFRCFCWTRSTYLRELYLALWHVEMTNAPTTR